MANSGIRIRREQLDDYYGTVIKEVETINKEDSDFSRYYYNRYLIYEGSFIYKKSTLTSFISTINPNTMTFMTNVGATDKINSYSFDRTTTPFLDAITATKYISLDSDNRENYEKYNEFKLSTLNGDLYGLIKNTIVTYKNPYVLNLGFSISNEVSNFGSLFIEENEITSIAYQNALFKSMVGTNKDLFKPVKIDKVSDSEWLIKFNKEIDIYLGLNLVIDGKDDVNVYLNDALASTREVSYNLSTGIFKVDSSLAKDDVTIKLETNSEIITSELFAYTFDWDVFEEGIEELKKNQLTDIEYSDGYVKGKVNIVDGKQVLFTSIAYEDGWTAYVDGKKAEFDKLYNSFIGLELEPGEHEVEFIYRTPGLRTGMMISLISLLLFIGYCFKRKQINEFIACLYVKLEEIILYLVVGVLTTVVSVLSYAMLAKVFGIPYMVSTVLSWIIAVLFAYVANKLVVFKTKLNTKKELLKEIYEFFKYRIVSLIMEVGLMYLMVSIMDINDVISKIVINIVVIIANYIFSKLFIFKK